MRSPKTSKVAEISGDPEDLDETIELLKKAFSGVFGHLEFSEIGTHPFERKQSSTSRRAFWLADWVATPLTPGEDI